MILNPDCIREVLLCLESDLKMNEQHRINSVSLDLITTRLSGKYSIDDIVYSLEQLISVKYIKGEITRGGMYGLIISTYFSDITWDGHQFLNTIRGEPVWNATKQGASKLGIMSVHALSTIAMKITEKVVTDPTVIAKITALF